MVTDQDYWNDAQQLMASRANEIKQLTEENARLRAALKNIVEYDIHNPMLPVMIAQEALKETL